MSTLFDLSSVEGKQSDHLINTTEPLSPIDDLHSNPYRRKEREYLEAIFARIPEGSYKHRIQQDILSKRPDRHFGAWYELMVYDWLEGLGKQPKLQPSISNARSKPDFLIESRGLPIFIEVTVVRQSQKDNNISGSGRGWWPAATATSRTMRESLITKMGQHQVPPNSAYVICLCLENRLIDLSEVKTSFFGDESVDIQSKETHPEYNGEIFERNGDMLLTKHSDVSALLVAKRNGDSVEDGYRLIFGLIQNPYALTPIPELEFGQIGRYVVVSETQTHFIMRWASNVR